VEVAESLQNLATLFDSQGDHEAAEPLLREAVVIEEEVRYAPLATYTSSCTGL
jgi:hypothetical protein